MSVCHTTVDQKYFHFVSLYTEDSSGRNQVDIIAEANWR